MKKIKEKQDQIVLYPKMLKQLFIDDWIPYRTGMEHKQDYVCVAIAVGKPKINKKTKEIEQKYIKRYLPREISKLLSAARSIK